MTLSASEVWGRLLDRARDDLPENVIETWLAPLAAAECTEQELVLTAPDSWSVEWNESKYGALLESYAPIALGHPLRIKWRVQTERLTRSQMDLFVPQAQQNGSTTAPSRRDLPAAKPSLNERYTFRNFVVGKSNELAVAAANAVASAPGRTYNPLFIYGSTGLGKTHLMQAIAHDVLASDPGARIIYVTTEQFTNEVITSISRKAMPEFRRRFREVDLLLVDDIQFLAGKEATQEEFFHTFETLYQNGRQVVLTSDRPPAEMQRLEARLVSRFEWGMVADVAQPDLEHRIAILRRKAEADHLEHTIPDEVLHFIADHVPGNVRELEGSIIKLLAYASLRHRAITTEVAREALRDKIRAPESAPARGSRQDLVRDIQETVAADFGVTVDGLQSKTRTKVLTIPRQVAMYLTRELLGLQLVEIGQAFGGRDHSTVIHSLERVEAMMGDSPDFRGRVERMRETLRTGG